MCQKLFRALRRINLISPKSLGSIDHVYPPYAGKETEEHRNLDRSLGQAHSLAPEFQCPSHLAVYGHQSVTKYLLRGQERVLALRTHILMRSGYCCI